MLRPASSPAVLTNLSLISSTIGPMLEPLSVRIYKARRAATEARLTGAGMPQDEVERWLAARETYAAAEGLVSADRDFWQRGFDWIATQRHPDR
jgi:hypothetical protein